MDLAEPEEEPGDCGGDRDLDLEPDRERERLFLLAVGELERDLDIARESGEPDREPALLEALDPERLRGGAGSLEPDRDLGRDPLDDTDLERERDLDLDPEAADRERDLEAPEPD